MRDVIKYRFHFRETTFVADLMVSTAVIRARRDTSELQAVRYHADRIRREDGWTVESVDRMAPDQDRWHLGYHWPLPPGPAVAASRRRSTDDERTDIISPDAGPKRWP